MIEITRDAIIAAYQRTEILPVTCTWATRATVGPDGQPAPEGREVACGCALVALCRAAGIDPEPLLRGRQPLRVALAGPLGISPDVAEAVVFGWDDWPLAVDPPLVDAERAAYLAAWEAAAAVLGPRGER